MNAAIEGAGSAGFVLGPAIGAVHRQARGRDCGVLAHGGVLGCRGGARLARPHRRSTSCRARTIPLAEFRDGLRVSYSTRTLRYVILSGTAVWFGFGAFSALEPLFFRDVVGVGVEWIGWMNTAFSVGLISGAWLLPKLPSRLVSVRGLAVMTSLCGLGAVAYVGSTDLRIIAVRCGALGASSSA